MNTVTAEDYKNITNLARYLRKRNKISRKLSDQDLEDIIQESAICLYRQRCTTENNIKLTPIILSRYKDFMRDKKRHEMNCSGGDILDHDYLSTTINTRLILIKKILFELPEYERWLLSQHFLEGNTHDTIALMAGKSRQVITVEISRAIQLMRRAIWRKPYRIK
ncbi:MAG: RNA polymerase sigma factor [Candidatus Hodarchaeota archaeon]